MSPPITKPSPAAPLRASERAEPVPQRTHPSAPTVAPESLPAPSRDGTSADQTPLPDLKTPPEFDDRATDHARPNGDTKRDAPDNPYTDGTKAPAPSNSNRTDDPGF
jgi:hypothetical protein